MNKASVLTLLFTLCITSTAAFSAQFYRWVDESGNTYIQSYIPPEFVKGGYEVIDDSGNILKTVAPQLSDSERKANAEAQISAEMQRARDEELLKFYRSPTDVDRAMKTWVSRMDMEIRVKRNRIKIKETEFDAIQERAAKQEKAGKAVDPEFVDKMKDIEFEIDQFELEIREVELRQDESRAEFMLDRNRMIILWELINHEDWVEPENPID